MPGFLAGTKQEDTTKNGVRLTSVREGQTCWQPALSFCSSRLICRTFSSKSLGLCLPVLYPHADFGSELWPQSRREVMKCCYNGKCHLIKHNLKGLLLYSCPMPSTRCDIQPCAERGRSTAPNAWEISAGQYGPFKYEQFAAFSASHITHRKLSGNVSSEQNTVLNEA